MRWAELEAETTALFKRLRQDLQRLRSEDDAIKAYFDKPRESRLKTLDAGRPGLAAQLFAVHLANLSSNALARKDGELWLDDAEPDALTNELTALSNLSNAL